MRELEPLDLAREYSRQLKHAVNRQEDARTYLAQYPGRGLEHVWESGGERHRVTVDHRFYQGIEKIVAARAKDLVDTGPQGEWQAERILYDPFAQPDEGEK